MISFGPNSCTIEIIEREKSTKMNKTNVAQNEKHEPLKASLIIIIIIMKDHDR